MRERVPDPETVVTAVAVVVLAVLLWGLFSIVRGSLVRPLEVVMFGLVFAVVYFGGLAALR